VRFGGEHAQPLAAALVGQIPFTLMHVLGTTVFTILLSPALYHWVVQNAALEHHFALLKRI